MERTLIADFDRGEGPKRTDPFEFPCSRYYGREPLIGKMKDGSLICFFLTGGPCEPHNQNVVVCSRSFDDGRTWTALETVFSHPYLGAWATELFLDGEHPMLVVSLYDADCPFRMLQTFVSYSDDCGRSWSAPVMANGVMRTASIRKIIRLSNGELLYPVYYTVADDCFSWDHTQRLKPDWFRGAHHECAVCVSPDEGAHVYACGHIAFERENLWEPNCVEAVPGHVIMLLRHSRKPGYLGRCDSFDYGRTWGPYQLTDIPNADSKPTAFSVNGKLCVIANFDCSVRRNLQLRISSDGLRSWERIIPLDDPEALFTYPHVCVDLPGHTLYIAYENYKQHYLLKMRFDEAGLEEKAAARSR